jgi:TPR repeat protein
VHPNAVWLTKLFAGRVVFTDEDARQVIRGCENDPRALCFADLFGSRFSAVRRAADLGDAFAQARMAGRRSGAQRFRWAEKSAFQGERDGFYELGCCYRDGKGCEEDVERAKENFLVAAKLGNVRAMTSFGRLFDKDDPQRFVWFGRTAANGESFYFLHEVIDQIRNFNSGTGSATVVFVIGRALREHIHNEERTIFGTYHRYNSPIGPANQALHFYEFQLQSYRKAVDS